MDHKRWVSGYILLILGLVTAGGVMNYIIDPYQLFKPDNVFCSYQRYANAGLAINQDYDAIIIGTSMTENFSPRYAKEKLGVNIIKLSISGGTAYEQRLTARLALRSRNVKTAVWGLDIFSFRGGPEALPSKFYTPVYLYDDNRLNDDKCLISIDTLQLSARKVLVKYCGWKSGRFEEDIEDNYNWYKEREGDFTLAHFKGHMGRLDFIDRAESPVTAERLDPEGMKKSFDENVLKVVKENPGTSFHLFFPPYSALFFYRMYVSSRADLDSIMEFKKYVFTRISRCPNARLYDFQTDFDVMLDVSQYSDPCHYRQSVNDRILDSMASGKFLVTGDNVEASLRMLKDCAKSLDCDAFLKEKSP